jgi:hypothetical protein
VQRDRSVDIPRFRCPDLHAISLRTPSAKSSGT